jgi:rubrerythrin
MPIGGGMARWQLDDIGWERFDAGKLDPGITRIVKAAALVEYNGGAYARHLCLVFADDPEFRASAQRWGEEEIQHGRALARWAALADPGFDFAAAFARFRDSFRVDFECSRSRRGSRTGEMVARCVVETGTSSYYRALADAAAEPVLKEICRRIAADEVRHYKLFRRTLERYRVREGVGFWRRLLVVLRRLAEARDDELACAYYAANEFNGRYDRRRCSRNYARHAFAVYREAHVAGAVKMLFKAAGLCANSRLCRAGERLAWQVMRRRALRLAALGA